MKNSFNVYKGAATSSWLLAILVIAAELIPVFKDFLKATFSHHWVAKAVLITILFLIVGFLTKDHVSKNDEKIAWQSIIGSLIVIFAFFIFEYFT